jgi:hypothetical protein
MLLKFTHQAPVMQIGHRGQARATSTRRRASATDAFVDTSAKESTLADNCGTARGRVRSETGKFKHVWARSATRPDAGPEPPHAAAADHARRTAGVRVAARGEVSKDARLRRRSPTTAFRCSRGRGSSRRSVTSEARSRARARRLRSRRHKQRFLTSCWADARRCLDDRR